MLYSNRKLQFQTEITEINTDGADLLKKGFCVSRGVLPLKEKGWWKFLSLSVLSEYFVYRKVIYTFTNYNLPQISLDRCYYTSSTYLHLSCPYRRRQLKEGNMAFSFISKKTTFSTSTPKAFFGLKKLTFCFPVPFRVRTKVLAGAQTFWRTQDFLPSRRRDGDKFSSWSAFTAKWFFLFKKGIWH